MKDVAIQLSTSRDWLSDTSANSAGKEETQLSSLVFNLFSKWLRKKTGITLRKSDQKALIEKLSIRVSHLCCRNIGEYLVTIASEVADLRLNRERAIAIELLTSKNVSFILKRPEFFDVIHAAYPVVGSHQVRCLYFGSSTGEEAYSLAFHLEDVFEGAWRIEAVDVNYGALVSSSSGIYHFQKANQIKPDHFKKYCFCDECLPRGTFKIRGSIRRNITFYRSSVFSDTSPSDLFDNVFLGNVLRYFNSKNKLLIVRRILTSMRRGGHLIFLGDPPNLDELKHRLRHLTTSVFMNV